MRGRNRKGPNPLARVLESNGPDVKIRGTASHIAEKYVTLARDAQASGDPVSAENYLQHAEHYFRMIAAAQAQMSPQQPFFREDQSRGDEGYDEDGDDEMYVNGAPVPGLGPQPIVAAPMYQREFREPYQRDGARPEAQAYTNGAHGGAPSPGASAAPATVAPAAAPAVTTANGTVEAPVEHHPEAATFEPAVAAPSEEDRTRRRRRGRRRVGETEAAAPESDTRPAED